MRNQIMKGNGFTMIEMLVSVLVFSFVAVSIYYLFDKGNWLYLHSQSRTNMQDNARLGMEFMEREIRMASFGVPAGTNLDIAAPEQSWLPDITLADVSEIGFRGDIDNINAMITTDAANGTNSLVVDNASRVCPVANFPIVIIQRGRSWEGTLCQSFSGSTLTILPLTKDDFEAAECEVYTPDHVWYKLEPDATNDGTCDNYTGAFDNDLENCQLQRCVKSSNVPLADNSSCSSSDWETVATNVRTLTYQYFQASNSDYPTPYTSLPLSTADRYRVDEIRITMKSTGRSDQAGTFQDIDLTSDILVRKRVL